MKISGIETFQLTSPLERPFGWSQNWIGHRSVNLVKVSTDEGIVGWGEGVGGEIVEGMLAPVLIGQDPTNRIGLWQRMFHALYNGQQRGRTRRVCHQRGRYGAVGHHRQGVRPAGLQSAWRQGPRPSRSVRHRPLLHRGRVPDATAGRGARVRRGWLHGYEDEGWRTTDGRGREEGRRAARGDRAGRQADGRCQPGVQRHQRDPHRSTAWRSTTWSGSRSR